jgi:hypothetical protein
MVGQSAKKLPAFHGNPWFITVFTKAPHLSPPSARRTQSTARHPICLRSITILFSHLGLGLSSCSLLHAFQPNPYTVSSASICAPYNVYKIFTGYSFVRQNLWVVWKPIPALSTRDTENFDEHSSSKQTLHTRSYLKKECLQPGKETEYFHALANSGLCSRRTVGPHLQHELAHRPLRIVLSTRAKERCLPYIVHVYISPYSAMHSTYTHIPLW